MNETVPTSVTIDAYQRGARLFDAGAFFEAHEAWEERWRVETRVESRLFFQGLIQIAAAFHKLSVVRDRASAARLLAKGLAKLDQCPELVTEVGIDAFRSALRALDLAQVVSPAIPKAEIARVRKAVGGSLLE